jgi:hypothetical protein
MQIDSNGKPLASNIYLENSRINELLINAIAFIVSEIANAYLEAQSKITRSYDLHATPM